MHDVCILVLECMMHTPAAAPPIENRIKKRDILLMGGAAAGANRGTMGLGLQISLYQHFFFQTAVSRKRNEILEMRWCQNSRIVEGVHPLFRESDLVPLFHPLSASFLKESTFLGCSRWAKLGHFGPKHAPGTLLDGPKKNMRGSSIECFPPIMYDP